MLMWKTPIHKDAHIKSNNSCWFDCVIVTYCTICYSVLMKFKFKRKTISCTLNLKRMWEHSFHSCIIFKLLLPLKAVWCPKINSIKKKVKSQTESQDCQYFSLIYSSLSFWIWLYLWHSFSLLFLCYSINSLLSCQRSTCPFSAFTLTAPASDLRPVPFQRPLFAYSITLKSISIKQVGNACVWRQILIYKNSTTYCQLSLWLQIWYSLFNLHQNPLSYPVYSPFPHRCHPKLYSVPCPRSPFLLSSLSAWLPCGWAAGCEVSSRALWSSLFSFFILCSSSRMSSTCGSSPVEEKDIRLSW